MDEDTRAALDEGDRLIAQYGQHERPRVPLHALPATWDRVLAVQTEGPGPWWIDTAREGWPRPVVFDAALHLTLITCAVNETLVRLTFARAIGSGTRYCIGVEQPS